MKVGDKVRSLVGKEYSRVKGKVYKITDIDSTGDVTQYWYVNDNGINVYTDEPETFEVVSPEVLEFDLWISKRDLKALINDNPSHGNLISYVSERDSFLAVKAKLIVEKPEEKKVEITEKQLEDAVKKYVRTRDGQHEIAENLKKELGL